MLPATHELVKIQGVVEDMLSNIQHVSFINFKPLELY